MATSLSGEKWPLGVTTGWDSWFVVSDASEVVSEWRLFLPWNLHTRNDFGILVFEALTRLALKSIWMDVLSHSHCWAFCNERPFRESVHGARAGRSQPHKLQRLIVMQMRWVLAVTAFSPQETRCLLDIDGGFSTQRVSAHNTNKLELVMINSAGHASANIFCDLCPVLNLRQYLKRKW